jgi:predicted P-loop ATPase
MVGTTNKLTEYLRDSTGNRRFWPVRVTRFDVGALARDRDQLWAEAAHREAVGESIRLPERLWAAATNEQEARRQIDPWEERIQDQLELDRDAITVEELWGAIGEAGRFMKRNDAERLAQIMQRHGYTRKKKVDVYYISEDETSFGGRRWAWIRDGKDPSHIEVEKSPSEF